MKAISLLQPWATLIMLGYKHFETRSWATKHRGPLAIHASLGKPAAARQACLENHHIKLILSKYDLTFDTLPRGVILGLCDVKGMLQIKEPGSGVKLGICDPALLQPVEVACGDYTAGRWAWQLQRHRPLATPVPCTGALQVWQVPADIAQRVETGEPEPLPTEEETYYDLATSESQQQYREAVEQCATTWAENFEELGGGDGEPYQVGQGDDLWVDLVERWDDEFDGDAVSDQDAARQLGTEVCEQVISTLAAKRSTEENYFDCICGAQLKRTDNPQQCSCLREHA